jgi:hypothetical protein
LTGHTCHQYPLCGQFNMFPVSQIAFFRNRLLKYLTLASL